VREHFLSKDPEKVGKTGPAIWPDWGLDPWRSPNFTKTMQGRRREGAVATIQLIADWLEDRGGCIGWKVFQGVDRTGGRTVLGDVSPTAQAGRI